MSGISKLIIKAYGDEAFSSEKGEFAATINPANLKITSSLDYSVSQAMGVNSLALRYNVSPPRVLSFKLLFDNTGIFPDTSTNVKDQLDSLQSIIYNFQDDIKEPYYIRVIWGTIDFKGKLVGLETSYTLFQADGSPSRAEADMVILEQVNPTGAAKSQQAQNSQGASSNTDNSSSGSGGSGGGGSNPSNSAATNAASSGGSTANGGASNNTSNSGSDTSGNTTSDASGNQAAEDANNPSSDAATDPNADTNNPDNADNAANQEAANNEAANNEAASNGEQSPADEANNQEAANEEQNTPNSTNSTTQETQAGDTLPAVAKKSLGDPNLAKDLAKLNNLDSLRDLAAGLKLHIPSLGIGALLAALLAMAKKYAKEGLNYVKKKAKAGEQKAVQLKHKVTKK